MLTNKTQVLRLTFAFLMIMWMFSSSTSLAQTSECNDHSSKPPLEQAKQYLSELNHRCSEKILLSILHNTSLSDLEKAQTHGWLAVTYSGMLQNKMERYQAAFKQYLSALQAYPAYKPEGIQGDTLIVSAYMKASDSLSLVNKHAAAARKNACEEYKRETKRHRLKRIIVAGGIAGTAAAAMVFQGKANDAYDKYELGVAPGDISASWNSYESKVRLRNFAIGTAVSFAIAEIYLLIKGPQKPGFNCDETVSISLVPGVGDGHSGARIQLALSFDGF